MRILAVTDAKIPAIQSERPASVTILGIIYVIFGVLMIMTVVMVVTFTSMMGDYSSMIGNMMGSTMTAFGSVIAVGVGILAVIEFVIAWVLLSGKRWGRITVMVLSMVDFIVHCATLVTGNLFAIPHIILDLIVFFYMWKPSVVSYFNREASSLR
ncbi:MAG: hypothetical protein HZA84_05860 [Thaumarchaeota archaeon]|nr:hypothetical protein [Nitrososphaerota archaeon]